MPFYKIIEDSKSGATTYRCDYTELESKNTQNSKYGYKQRRDVQSIPNRSENAHAECVIALHLAKDSIKCEPYCQI